MAKPSFIQALAIGLCVFSAAAQAQTSYAVTNLASLGKDIQWTGINNAGMLAGTDILRVYTASNGVVNAYAPLEWFNWTYDVGINNNGTIIYGTLAGEAFTPNRAYIGNNGNVTEIPQLYGEFWDANTRPYGLNDAGTVVGTGSHFNKDCVGDPGCERGSRWDRAFVYQNGTATDLGTLGGNESGALAVNNAGTVVGWAQNSQGREQAFLYTAGGGMQALGNGLDKANGINDRGQIIGGGGGSAWLYDRGVLTTFALAGNAVFATDINNDGLVSGYAVDAAGKSQGWVYLDGQIVLLDTLLGAGGYHVTKVLDMNDAGQIVAEALAADGGTNYVLLSPVPEPGTYAMLIGGLGILAALRRRRA